MRSSPTRSTRGVSRRSSGPARAARLEGDGATARRLLDDALGLWRGPPLAEVASAPFAPAEIARLEEQRLAALEVRVEADLAVGRHPLVVAELEQLRPEHPWRERLHAQLMLALYRSGRQADALEAYTAESSSRIGIEPAGANGLEALASQSLRHLERGDPARRSFARGRNR